MRRALRWQWLLGFACLLAMVDLAHGAPTGVFDQTEQLYKTAAAGWYARAYAIAVGLFWKLAAIEFAWSAITWALNRQEEQAFVASVVKKLISIGFFYAILSQANYWIPAIVNGLAKVGTESGGVAALTPSEVVSVGLDAGWQLLKSLNNLGLGEVIGIGLPVALMAVVIVFSFSVVGGQLLIALIESYVIMGVGVFFLGFNGSRWTTDFGQKFIGYAIATGVKLMMTYLIIAVGMSITDQFSDLLKNTVAGNNLIENALTITSASLIFAFLCWSIPKTASALMSGAPALSAGGAISAGMGTAAAVVAGGAMLAQAGKAAMSPVMNAAKDAAVFGGASSGAQAATTLSPSARESVEGLGSAVRNEARPSTGGTDATGLPASGSGGSIQKASQTSGEGGSKDSGQAVRPPQALDDQSTARRSSESLQDDVPVDTATNDARKRLAGDITADNAPPKLGSVAGETAAKNISATSSSAASDEENSIGAAALPGTPKDAGSGPSRLDRALERMSQVRPPQVPHDEAGGGTIHVRLDPGAD